MEKNNLSTSHVEHQDGVIRVDVATIRKLSAANPELTHITTEAKGATQAEKSMGLFQAIRLYPKAVGWSMLLSTAIVMEGYDLMLLSNFYAFPPFTRHYGLYDPKSGSYQV
jgi:MFS transporter, SP family, general alpha glucoside:H+ symporter